MTITKTQLGRLAGFVILTLIVAALSWGAVAWLTWQADPGQWSLPMRGTYLGFVFLLSLCHYLHRNVTIVDDGAQRR